MTKINLKPSACLLLLALMLFPTSELAAQVARTDWQMHEGMTQNIENIDVFDSRDGTGNTRPERSNIVFRFATPFADHGNEGVYKYAEVPPKSAPGWKSAPDPNVIGFSAQSRIPGESYTTNCRKAADYTYFQTFVTVPNGTTVNQFEIAFDGMDDGSRVTIFDETTNTETQVEDSYVKLGGKGTTNLAEHIQRPGTYRVVITQVDDCAYENRLESAEVKLNGQTIKVDTTPVNTTPIVTNAHGDVHISTPDGLVYDLQTMGEVILSQSTDKNVVVQTRQEMWETNPKVSINTAVAMMVGGDKVEFYLKPTRSFYVNDQLMDVPSSRLQLPSGGYITSSGNESRQDLVIYWPNKTFGARVILYSDSHIDVGVAKYDSKTYEGVVGNLDGNARNDLQMRNGNQLSAPASADVLKSFSDSWQVSGSERLFRGGNVDQAVASEPPLTILDLDVAKRAAAKEACQNAGVSDQLALSNCTYDVAVTGDRVFIESAKVYEEATEDVPAAARVPGDVTGKVALTGSVFPLAERFDFQVGTKYPSESGNHYLVFQEDGNLVVYTATGGYVWGIQNSGKDYGRNTRAVMQEDGNLVTYDGDEPIWATDTYGNAGATLALTPAGELQIVQGSRALWSSGNTQ